jgi:alginate production protein
MGAEGQPAPKLPAVLRYQYGYGSESDLVYRRDRDLNRGLRDNELTLTPQIGGILVYRPTSWLETTLEVLAEREIPVQEEAFVQLPGGEIRQPVRRRASLLIDQAFVAVKNVTAPFEFALGRRNYEDERHFLYDTSMDIVSVGYRKGTFRAEAFAGREVLVDLDLAPHQHEQRDRIDTLVLYADYRGIPDLRLAAYAIDRNDRAGEEGRPRTYGLRALGNPSYRSSYWAELAVQRGRDEEGRALGGRALDVGYTRRFIDVPMHPHVTLAYAFASGDAGPQGGRNREFRQSGLHSNETRLGGFPEFKVYGEALDPDLSNLRILTAGVGFRPTPTVSVELVWHRYRLDEVSESLRGTALTAEMNQVLPSRDVGRAVDLIVAFRHLFGMRRLGVDLRLGWFSPGEAFLRDEGDEENPLVRRSQKAFAVVGKLWW